MWPFKTKMLEFSYEDSPESPQEGDYRIVPEYSGWFQVEIYDHIYSRPMWHIAGAHSYTYEPSCFATEKEAEAYIFKKRAARLESEIKARKVAEFKKANPPREVPPYKFI